jgi:hypothetical protein
VAALAVVICAVLAPAALAQTTTIGESTLTPSLSPPTAGVGQDIPVFQGAAGAGYVLRSPQAGTITSWSFLSAGIATGKHFVLRVLEPVGAGGQNWRAVGTSAAVGVTSETGTDAVNGPFAVSMAIAKGDVIAMQPTDDSFTPSEEGTLGTDGIRYFNGVVADGSTAEIAKSSEMNNGQLVPVQATVEYSAAGPPPPPVAPANTSAPTLAGGTSGLVKAGQTLQCATGSWSGGPALTVAWFQQTTAPGVPEQFATARAIGGGASLRLPSLQPGKRVFCQVTATTPGGTSVATSASLVVQAIKPALQTAKLAGRLGAAPRVTKRVAPGNLDICSTGSWQNYPSSFKYRWVRSVHGFARGGIATLTARIVGRSPVIKIRPSFAGSSLICSVTAANAAGTLTVSSGPTDVPKPSEVLGVAVSCGAHVGAKSIFNGCPGTGINVIIPSQPGGHSLNPTSNVSHPLSTYAHPPSVPRAGRFLLECEPPRFNTKAKLTYRWTVLNLEFVNNQNRYVEEGFVESYRVLKGHFLTIDHGVFTARGDELEYLFGWLETSSADSGHQVEQVQQLGEGEQMVVCEAEGSAAGTSDWGRSPALYVRGSSQGLLPTDLGIIGTYEL